ncbi:AraC family transcriptional regulator [Pseudomonas sp. NPDC089569]|uniref:helix-turn-helix transcriptional regulator n=1 Tax=Pseudomonas sp. NPDC089569 TaxID=3390722 RepID=UPI003D0282BA
MQGSTRYHRAKQVQGLTLGEAELGEFCFKKHFHLDYHLGLITRGVERIGFRGASEKVGPGSITFMPAFEVHDGSGDSYSSDTHTLKTFRINKHLMQSMMTEVLGHDHDVSLTPSITPSSYWWHQMNRFHDALIGPTHISELAFEQVMLQFVYFLFVHTQKLVAQPCDGTLSRNEWSRVVDFCNVNMSDKIVLHDLASLVGLDRFQFLRAFSQTTGITPHAWLLRLRLENACALLSAGKHSVAQVAAEVGFYDQSHFSRAFKTAYNVSPSSYQSIS